MTMNTIKFYAALILLVLSVSIAGVAMGAMIALTMAKSAKAAERVDVALILAVDHSSSVDAEEWALQLKGYADAFRSDAVHQTIAGGPIGRIAVTMFRWSHEEYQQVLVPWTMIDGPQAANEFADAIVENSKLTNLYNTCISGALLFSDQLFQELPFKAERLVVDVSGDEPENCPADHPPAREISKLLVDQGVQINGLPILSDGVQGQIYGVPYQGNSNEAVERFYRENVIGGPGAFIVTAKGFHAFGQAVLRKLMLEIASL